MTSSVAHLTLKNKDFWGETFCDVTFLLATVGYVTRGGRRVTCSRAFRGNDVERCAVDAITKEFKEPVGECACVGIGLAAATVRSQLRLE